MSKKLTGIVVIMAIALVAVFIANRFSPIKNIVYGTPSS